MRAFKFRRSLGAAALALVLSTAALAQDAPSISGHFRVYQAAIQRNDLAAAETAAAAALALSEQKDGDGGRTAVLAFNLARVRVQQGRWQEARAPAQKAYTLSRTGAAGVDPYMSALLSARIRLQLDGGAASSELSSLLDQTANREDLIGDRFDAAEQLGIWASQSRSFLIARSAWAQAAEAARGAPYDVRFALGRARAYEGMAIISQSVTRNVTMSETVANQARERLKEAHGLVRPFAYSPAQAGAYSKPQQVYAEILAWDSALWSLMSRNLMQARRNERLDSNPKSIDGKPVCDIERVSGDRLTYPQNMVMDGQLGAVVVALRFDAAGVYQGLDVLSYAGDEPFMRTVARSASTWVFKTKSTVGCTPAPVFYMPIAFNIRD